MSREKKLVPNVIGPNLTMWRNSRTPKIPRRLVGAVFGIPESKVSSIEAGRKLTRELQDAFTATIPVLLTGGTDLPPPHEFTPVVDIGACALCMKTDEHKAPQITWPEYFPDEDSQLMADIDTAFDLVDPPQDEAAEDAYLIDLAEKAKASSTRRTPMAEVLASIEAEEQDTSPRKFSNSELNTFKRCRRKWWLGWYRGLRLKDKDPTGPLTIGTRIHLALAVMYDPDTRGRVDPFAVLDRAVTEDWTAYNRVMRDKGQEVSGDVIKQFSKDTQLERIILEEYMEWLSATGADSGLEAVSAETYLEAPFPVPGTDRELLMIGKLDARVRRETDNARLFIDHKTVQAFSLPLAVLKSDEQMLHYSLLEWLSDPEGVRSEGAIYNMLRKVQHSARSKPPYFMRMEVHHNLSELESFRKRLTGVLTTLLQVEAALASGQDPAVVVFPSPNRQCAWDCEFFRMCHMLDDGSRAEDLLKAQYTTGDPLDYYKSKEETE